MHVKEPSKCGRPVRIARDAKRDASRQNLRSERDRSRGAVSELRVHPTRRSTVIGSPPHGDPVQALDQRGPIAVVAVDDRIGFPLADGDQPVGCHSLPDEIALDGVGPTLREAPLQPGADATPALGSKAVQCAADVHIGSRRVRKRCRVRCNSFAHIRA